MNIGFIGCGNMAKAIIGGIINAHKVKSENIFFYDVNKDASRLAKEQFNINKCESENEVVANSDAVILAVKPNVIADVLKSISPDIENKSIPVISIAAGKTIEFLSSYLPKGSRVIRVMPNINAAVGKAMSAYTANEAATNSDKALCEKIFESVGKIIYLEEKFFAVFGVVGGCAPAFTYMFIDSLARAAVKNGMNKETALTVAAQTVLGSAEMILHSNEHPWELIDKVCSPGGTTIEGVTSLQNDGFETAVNNAVDRAIEKDSKL